MIEEEADARKDESTKSIDDESDFAIHGSAITTGAATASSSDTAGNTFIIKGRKRALQEAYSRSAKHSYYCVTGQELAKSYKPFLPLLRLTVHGGEIISVISRNAKRLHKLAENILDVTRIESKNLKLRKEQFNFDDLISAVVRDYREHLEESNSKIGLSYNNRTEDLVVEADRNSILQVIYNLLDNAIKFTKEGNIMLNIQKKDDSYVEVGIRDTGVGIEPDIYQRLFSKFATKSLKEQAWAYLYQKA